MKCTSPNRTSILGTAPSLREAVGREEKRLIKLALAACNGGVTAAAHLLGESHQTLIYIICARHPELLAKRSPVMKRKQHLIEHSRPRKRFFKR